MRLRRRDPSIASGARRKSSKPMYLLDTNVASELRRPYPNPSVVVWIAGVPGDQLFLSAVTVGEIQASIEITREQDAAIAAELESRLYQVFGPYHVLPTLESHLIDKVRDD